MLYRISCYTESYYKGFLLYHHISVLSFAMLLTCAEHQSVSYGHQVCLAVALDWATQAGNDPRSRVCGKYWLPLHCWEPVEIRGHDNENKSTKNPFSPHDLTKTCSFCIAKFKTQIVAKFCIKHDSNTGMLCAKVHNDLMTENIVTNLEISFSMTVFHIYCSLWLFFSP